MNFSEPHDSKLIDYIKKTYGYDGTEKIMMMKTLSNS